MPRLADVAKKILGRGGQEGGPRREVLLLAETHHQLFNEPVLPAAIAAWSDALDTGVTFQFLLAELLYSRSHRPLAIEDFVESAYVALLGRPADAAGAAGFVSAVGSLGLSPRAFLEELVKSDEFQLKRGEGKASTRRKGGVPSDLPIAVDATEGTLPGGASSVYKIDGAALITSGYLAVLGRPASDADIEGYLRGFTSGDLTPVSFLSSLMDSQEFQNRLPGHRVIGPFLLRPLYESIVGQPMPDDVLATWLNELNRGANFDLLVKNLREHHPVRSARDAQLLALAFVGLQSKISA